MVNIYILQLENNSLGMYTPLQGYKYYIGKTTQPKIRLESHLNSNGSYRTIKTKSFIIIMLAC
jgi:predicted GIY-YIG superfamily endonuclease